MTGAREINFMLPNEILSTIFQSLDTKDQFSCHAVCSRWQGVVANCVPVELHVGHPTGGPLWTQEKRALFKSISAIREFRVDKCYVSRLQKEGDPFLPIDPSLTWMKPNLLKYLWIDGYLRPTLFNHLTVHLTNLKTLVIHFSTLSTLQGCELNLGILVTLEEFTIHLMTGDEVHLVHIRAGILNGITLLESRALTFPNLKTLTLNFPRSASHMRVLNRAMCGFCNRHAQTLKGFEVVYWNFITRANRFRGDPGPHLTLANVQGMTLDSLNIYIEEDDPEMAVFRMLLNDQRNLKQINVSMFLDLVDILPPLRNCHGTLTKVEFHVIIGLRQPPGPLNLSILGSCPNLEKLKLLAVDRVLDMDETEETLADVTFGGVQLPPSLKSISFTSLYMTSGDILALVDQKPVLEEIKLMFAGTLGNLGIPFQRLVEIVKERKVKTIRVGSSVNLRSLRTAANSEDPCIKLAILFMGMSSNPLEGGRLDLILNPGGEYQSVGQQIPVDEPMDDDEDEEDPDDEDEEGNDDEDDEW